MKRNSPTQPKESGVGSVGRTWSTTPPAGPAKMGVKDTGMGRVMTPTTGQRIVKMTTEDGPLGRVFKQHRGGGTY